MFVLTDKKTGGIYAVNSKDLSKTVRSLKILMTPKDMLDYYKQMIMMKN